MKPLNGEKPPRMEFWHKSLLEDRLWTASLGGCEWELRKTRDGLLRLYGVDPDSTVTVGQVMGTHLGPAQQTAQRWITRRWEREQIRRTMEEVEQ